MGDFAPSLGAEGPGTMELHMSTQNACGVFSEGWKTTKGGLAFFDFETLPCLVAILEIDVTFPGEELKKKKSTPCLAFILAAWVLGVECSAVYKAKSVFLMLPYRWQIQCRRANQDSKLQLRTPGCEGCSSCVAESAGVTTEPCSNIPNTNF